MKFEKSFENNVHIWRTECQQMVKEHCVATVDWLIGFHGIAPSKLYEMWSVLDIDTELDDMKSAKQSAATKKVTTSKQPKAKSTASTPVKMPKTRQQKKTHIKVIFFFLRTFGISYSKLKEGLGEDAGGSNISEHAKLESIRKTSQVEALQENVS